MAKYKIRILNPVMGVLLTALNKLLPEQFDILGVLSATNYPENFMYMGEKTVAVSKDGRQYNYVGPTVNGTAVYKRLLIRKHYEKE